MLQATSLGQRVVDTNLAPEVIHHCFPLSLAELGLRYLRCNWRRLYALHVLEAQIFRLQDRGYQLILVGALDGTYGEVTLEFLLFLC